VDVAVQAPPTATVNQLDDDISDRALNKFSGDFSEKLPGMLLD